MPKSQHINTKGLMSLLWSYTFYFDLFYKHVAPMELAHDQNY